MRDIEIIDELIESIDKSFQDFIIVRNKYQKENPELIERIDNLCNLDKNIQTKKENIIKAVLLGFRDGLEHSKRQTLYDDRKLSNDEKFEKEEKKENVSNKLDSLTGLDISIEKGHEIIDKSKEILSRRLSDDNNFIQELSKIKKEDRDSYYKTDQETESRDLRGIHESINEGFKILDESSRILNKRMTDDKKIFEEINKIKGDIEQECMNIKSKTRDLNEKPLSDKERNAYEHLLISLRRHLANIQKQYSQLCVIGDEEAKEECYSDIIKCVGLVKSIIEILGYDKSIISEEKIDADEDDENKHL